MKTHQLAALSSALLNKKSIRLGFIYICLECPYRLDQVFTFREDLRYFFDAGSVSGWVTDRFWSSGCEDNFEICNAPEEEEEVEDCSTKTDVVRLHSSSIRKRQRWIARRVFKILASKSDDNTSYEAIASALQFATQEILPNRARASEPLWFSKSVLALRGLINLRNNAFDAYRAKPRLESLRFALQSARGTLQCAIKKAQSDWILSSWIESMTGSAEPLRLQSCKRAAIKTLKRGFGRPKRPSPVRINLVDGTSASSAEENARVFAKHFEKLYSGEPIYDATILSCLPHCGQQRKVSIMHLPNLKYSRPFSNYMTRPPAVQRWELQHEGIGGLRLIIWCDFRFHNDFWTSEQLLVLEQ